MLGVAMVVLAVAHNLLRAGFPPGVDTPTFLHMSWFTRETLRGDGGLVDPYWYGGFSLYTTYPPLSYGLVGLLAAVPGVGLVLTYKVVLLAAHAAIGAATYFLALQLANTRGWAALAALLAVLAYPALVAVGLWGWFSSVVALPFALLAFGLLERAHTGGRRRLSVAGGVALGLSFLAHHMTAFAFGLGLPIWVLFHHWRQPDQRRYLYTLTLLFTGAAVASTVWWVIPWALNLAEAGFERETPGLWSFPLWSYLEALTQRDLIGLYAYPNYIGVGFIALAIGGVIQALVTPSRTTPYAILLIVFVAFSLGEQVNPLVRVWPLSGLDVARFQVYMVPLMVLVGLPFLANLPGAVGELLRARRVPGWPSAVVSGLLVVLVVGQVLWDGALASRRLFHPYRLSLAAGQAVKWLGEDGHEGKVLGVGFWHWDDFLLPYYVGRSVVDGWHDEGAKDWRSVRALRMMMWTREVDIPLAHQLLGELDGRYIAVQDYFAGESPDMFREAFADHPELFGQVADWGEVTIFERVPR